MRLKALLDETSRLQTARDEGKIERDLEIATNLLDVLDDETISLKTGLPLNTIQQLRKSSTT
ncbi:hypothetical protein NEH72_07605 [Turicibacter sp. 1E2]|uniref:Uncharacterized protein n=1 Tax=Turicibacter faecis TaxID=2963365 RepID=A0ABN6ZDH2_9FIRM|nr:hypothetical protein [Turicibacter sp. TA25]MCU7209705.1 hypothetical protein [Turicibacter sp. 1E2]BEH91656.1 hypothetical protein T23_17580 [Turicibacter sp. TC023]